MIAKILNLERSPSILQLFLYFFDDKELKKS